MFAEFDIEITLSQIKAKKTAKQGAIIITYKYPLEKLNAILDLK